MINKEEIKEMDSHWNEVMDLAVKYGFITYAFGGTAILATHANQLYRQILFLVEDAIQRRNDEIAILRGAKIEKTHKRKRYVFEVSRNRIGAADVYLNGELVANMLDEVVDAVEPENIQTDIVKGKGSTIPDAVFVKSVLYSLGDAVCRLSDRVKAILDRDIPEEVREKLQENLRRAKP